ncbi:MAG: hypothetical protein EU535_02315 [Promethearchaeota archaeon]|nr:MAG: hypothetical protein EU535_02315 [Candidatus Lokiarchaeota archaeon]
MNATENENSSEAKPSVQQQRREAQKRVRKSQMQILQEALGLKPQDIQEVEKKLFIAKFFDYFKEETLDFVYKDRSLEMYKNEINRFFDAVESEEDKLLKKKFTDKKLMDIIYNLKKNAEELALNKANIKKPIDKRIRNLRLIITLPMFGVLIILMFFIPIWYVIPLLCAFCVVPQLLQASIMRKWYDFKETNKNDFFVENRNDLLTLKDFAAELLSNIRSRLLEMKVPLQIIKFILHSRDYENMKLLNQTTVRGSNQYVFNFEYPPGMEPFPIPEELLPPQPPKKTPETNFIVLSELKTENGVIKSFVPVLKSMISDKINGILNECEFSSAPKNFKALIPNYSENMAIYCICGDIAEIKGVQVCNWKNQFKFYLFESVECKCGDTIYALSVMDDKDKIPDELKEIFSS